MVDLARRSPWRALYLDLMHPPCAGGRPRASNESGEEPRSGKELGSDEVELEFSEALD